MRVSRKREAVFFILLIGALAAIVFGVEVGRRLSSRQDVSSAGGEAMPNGATSAYPRELRDNTGRVLAIGSPPSRIVSQTLGTDEILMAICPVDRIVGLSELALEEDYSNVAAEARSASIPIVRGPEQVLQLQPDLIFIASYSRAEEVELLNAAGAPVFRFSNFDRLDDIKSNIRTLGYTIGEEERAEALVAEMERRLEAARARVPALKKRPRVMSYGRQSYTTGTNTLFDDVIREAGAVNVSAEHGITGFQTISGEQIARWRPDFLVIGSDRERFEETRRQLIANPAVASSGFGRAGRIIVIDNRYFLTVSHHVVEAIEALEDGLYSSRNQADTERKEL